MNSKMHERQALALRKHCVPLLKTLGVKDPNDYEPHRRDWKTLQKHRNEVVRAARATLELLKDDTPEHEGRAIEDRHDGLMALFDAIDGENNQRQAAGSLGPREHGGNLRRPIGDNDSARGDGMDDDPDVSEARIYALRPEQRMADWLRREGRGGELGGLSEGRYLRAMVLGAKTDLERRALSEGTDSAGGYTVPELLSARLIDRMRAASVVMRAGAMTAPLGSDTNYIGKVTADPVPAWRSENAAFAEGDPTFGRVTLTPRSLGIVLKVSLELLQDSLNMEMALPDLIATAMAQELDRVALLGTGVAPQPKGVVNFSGLTANSFGGGALASYSPLITARTALRTANSDVTGYVMSPRDDGTLADLKATDNQPLQKPPAIEDIPFLVTSKMPIDGGVGTNESQIIAGDWRRLIIGMRTELMIMVLKERYLADAGQYGFVAMLRADVAAEHEAAFTVLDAITP